MRQSVGSRGAEEAPARSLVLERTGERGAPVTRGDCAAGEARTPAASPDADLSLSEMRAEMRDGAESAPR